MLTGKETKAVRAKIEKQYPNIKDYLDDIWPKKEQVLQLRIKGEQNLTLYQI